MDFKQEDRNSESSESENEEKFEIEVFEINPCESGAVEHLFIAPYGNAFAYLKASLYVPLEGSKALKSKIRVVNTEDRNAKKKVVAEFRQFEHNSRLYTLLTFRPGFI
eukprot:UN07525